MAKVASSTTVKRASSPKNTAAPLKSRSRTTKDVAAKEVTEREATDPPLVLVPEPSIDGVQLLTERFNALEEKITTSFSSLATELQTLKTTSPSVAPDGMPESETLLPIIGDLIRRHLVEQLNPLIASLKRIEERVGFIGNRLKHPGQNPEQRPKPPWRHDQQRHNNRPRGHNGAPRPGPGPGPGQPWTPPNAASVQGHFAPRPLRGGESDQLPEDDE